MRRYNRLLQEVQKLLAILLLALFICHVGPSPEADTFERLVQKDVDIVSEGHARDRERGKGRIYQDCHQGCLPHQGERGRSDHPSAPHTICGGRAKGRQQCARRASPPAGMKLSSICCSRIGPCLRGRTRAVLTAEHANLQSQRIVNLHHDFTRQVKSCLYPDCCDAVPQAGCTTSE